MDYVNLSRRFRTVDPDKPLDLTDWEALGFGMDAGLDWGALLYRPRVVVLAEALAGKTAEFRAQATRLRSEGRYGFYLTIEAVADQGLEAVLNRQDWAAFEEWRRSTSPAWFFLDSVDEARINRRNIEAGFNRFARALEPAYDRARVLISCRGNVWDGEEDLALVRRTLEPVTAPTQLPSISADDALFASAETAKATVAAVPEPPAISVVALTKLTAAQRRTYLASARVRDPEAFERALGEQNLSQFAERPGDLAMLAGFWLKEGRFDGLREMTEAGIALRLAETNPLRRAALAKPTEELRAAAERLAAAMTLGRTMTIRLPDQHASATEGLDPHQVLGDWSETEVDALFQRGLFVPSTYGLVRFFHRSAQEYLAARWFARLGERLTDAELFRVFFNTSFGVRTVPPSLRAVAGWLALWRPTLRRELLAREPLVLIRQGDPRQLSLPEKERLLAVFAERQARGDLAYARLDHHSLWLFAEPALAPAINAAVADNGRHDFRLDMLRLVEQGRISGCLDLARAASLEPPTHPYHRIVGTRILRLLGDVEGLRRVTADMLSAPSALGPELAPYLAVALYPSAMTVDELLVVIEQSRPGREFHAEGFGPELATLFAACPTTEERRRFVDGVAALAFKPPLDDWPYVSKRHRQLVKQLGALASAAIRANDREELGLGLVTLLMAVERGGESGRRPARDDVAELVEARPALKRALFWADVRRTIDFDKEGKTIVRVSQLWPADRVLWSIRVSDREWLEEALDRRADEARLALSALIELASLDHDPEASLDRLAQIVAVHPASAEVLAEARRPPVETEDDRRWREHGETHLKLVADREKERRERLSDLRDRVLADGRMLTDPEHLATKFGFRDLLDLTNWMGTRPGQPSDAQRWAMLEVAFGPSVAVGYRQGMKTMWRVTEPERPTLRKNGQRSTKWAIILSMGGLELESREAGWAARLTPALASRAAAHACLDEQGVTDWIGELIDAHSAVVPAVLAEITREWLRSTGHHPFLEKAAHGLSLPPPLRTGLLALVARGRMKRELLDVTRRLLSRMELTSEERAPLVRRFVRRLAAAEAAGDWEVTIGTLATLFILDPEIAAQRLFETIAAEGRSPESRAWNALTALFGWHRGTVASFDGLATESLRRLIVHAYAEKDRGVAASDDDDDDEPVRDRFDEAGGTALSALIERDGREAYDAMLRLARDPAVGESAHRLTELAYEMAERQSERPIWSADEVRAFEAKARSPLRSGDDLLDYVLSLLDDIQHAFENDDMTSRLVVRRATHEREVQDWLGEALVTRSDRRLHVVKEGQVADAKRPDLFIGAAECPAQLAIEVKHAERGWTYPDLRRALEVQLVQQYLRPANRRHGVLVISNHRPARYWRGEGRRLYFPDLVAALGRVAAGLTANATGPIAAAVRGIDASVGRD